LDYHAELVDRHARKPYKLPVSYPGTISYNPQTFDGDSRHPNFRDHELKKTGSIAQGTNHVRGAGYVPGKGVGVKADSEFPQAVSPNRQGRLYNTTGVTSTMMIFPGKVVLRTQDITNDARYARYDGLVSQTTARVAFPGYSNDPNALTVAHLSAQLKQSFPVRSVHDSQENLVA
jgi:hypothetical protein